MLVEESQVRSKIRRIVERLECPSGLREDMVQEATIHFWLRETQCPGRTLKWYCQACVFHVRHVAEQGGSIDSPKRQHLGCQVAEPGDDAEAGRYEVAASSGTPLDDCSAREILDLLSRRLDRRALRIVCLLAAGCGVREVAARVGLSHTAVSKVRRCVRDVAKELGIES